MTDYDVHAERAVLAAAIQGRTDAFVAVAPEAFTHWISQELASAIRQTIAKGIPVELPTVVRHAAAAVGGGTRGDEINRAAVDLVTWPVIGASEYHAERITTLLATRQLSYALETAKRLTEYATENDDPTVRADALKDARAAMEKFESMVAGPVAQAPPDSVGDVLAETDEPHNWLVPGLLERMDRLILTGFEGTGKALHVRTPIPTPKGWRTMGELSIGDEVFGPDGDTARIIAATEVMDGRPCFRVTFSDGAEIIADANHMWVTETLEAREAASRQARRGPTKPRGTDQRHQVKHHAAVVTTQQMAGTLHVRDGHAVNHSIATTAPLQYPAREQPIPAYVLGCWLGDGTGVNASFTCADEEIVDHIRATGEPIRKEGDRYMWRFTDGVRHGRGLSTALTMQARLRALGVLGNKHIPELYQHASIEQRLALLQGLMDTDGTVDTKGMCEFSVCDEVLARDAHELLLGLGVKVRLAEGAATLNGRVVGTRYRLHFQTDLPVFKLSRKAERLQPLRTRRAKLRYIVAVDAVPSVPVRCIQVDREDGMFVASRSCIPTHNSYLLAQLALTVAAGLHPFTTDPLPAGQYRTLVLDAENSRNQIRRRYRRIVAQIDTLRSINDLGPVNWKECARLVIRPEGFDLTDPSEMARIVYAIESTSPDLVVAGPLYKMSRLNIQEEQAAQELTLTLDALRAKYGFTLICEAHAGHTNDGGGMRKVRPIGSSLFLRWPEFGFGIVPHPDDTSEHPETVLVKHWRGSREERDWPDVLKHGDMLPWEVADSGYYDRVRKHTL